VLVENSSQDRELHAFVKEASRRSDRIPVVMLSQSQSWDSYLEALAAGAYDYVAYPPAIGELERALRAAISESKRIERLSIRPLA
jgi:DNA-binding NtrC family response regulator